VFAGLALDGFVVMPDASVTISCRRKWKPADDAEASSSLVVHAYDALLDPPTRRFDARSDRHVGRRDSIPDFSGTWNGLQYVAPGPLGRGYLYRVVIEQTGAAVNVTIFEEITEVSGITPVPGGVTGTGRRTPLPRGATVIGRPTSLPGGVTGIGGELRAK